ncbi:hypothetical protein F4810DRAFT_686690 [Camillea tinctor]|nr:hypothetical protein F4810DRAFT_686690 [Camillea tinctor]
MMEGFPSFDDLHKSWGEYKQLMTEKHNKELDYCNCQLEEEKDDARNASERDRLKIQETNVSPEAKTAAMQIIQNQLVDKLQDIEKDYKEKFCSIKKGQDLERHHLEISYREALNDRLKVPQTPTISSSPVTSTSIHITNTNTPSGQKPVAPTFSTTDPHGTWRLTKPFTHKIEWTDVDGEKRLLLKYKLQKRRAPEPVTMPDSKRIRSSSPTHAPQIPFTTPRGQNCQQLQRTITFDEVYQGGNALHKDTIVEWPKNSRRWYIVKCEAHNHRFTRQPLSGAGMHLDSKDHGYQERSWDNAIKALGYCVTDCDEAKAQLNNMKAEESYGNSNTQVPYPKAGTKIRKRGGRASASEFQPITNPKPFHIYYARWEGDKYPALILGWDKQTEAGLKGTLGDTGLFGDTSDMPVCYKYGHNRILGWASGYQDGGSKVNSRKFPVMFLEPGYTVAWIPARFLSKFPLDRRRAPRFSHGTVRFARDWLARKEGFPSWRARASAKQAKDKTDLGIPPAGSPNHFDGNANSNHNGDFEMSDASEDAELEEIREKGGEISDDEEYQESRPDSGSAEETDFIEGDDDLLQVKRPWTLDNSRRSEEVNLVQSKRPTPQDTDHDYGKAYRELAIGEHCEHDNDNYLAQMDATLESNGLSPHENYQTLHIAQAPGTSMGSKQQLVEEKNPGGAVFSYENLELLNRMLDHGVAPPSSSSKISSATPERASSIPITAPTTVFSNQPTATSNVSSSTALVSTTEVETLEAIVVTEPSLPVPAHSETPTGQPNFEISMYNDGYTSWKRASETTDSCLKLYCSADQKRVHIRGGQVMADIDPLSLASYSREMSHGSSENNKTMVLTGKKEGENGIESVMELIFDRTRGSTLPIGKIQAHRFIVWLRKVNPDITFVDT